ncbi:SH3 and multiple ankyrin repeat domains protein 2 [Puma concolor]|uniref:SH3 and multiple ankyrin repeat domains protein 2 n=1 Tax=Puma concolor TaxID=9696 RepID=A0A6P6H7C6_PUMCO|nr:SH3 and multiple ankyrin repeat domains protein 2 [Puma concolor]
MAVAVEPSPGESTHFRRETCAPPSSQGPTRGQPGNTTQAGIEVSLVFPADTPIEEFTPTPAFPALQYLESVDEGGVAWQAGLRTGDFLIEVNKENVVKVGHRQVVNMIRQGGNHLVLKVVTVTRNLDPDDTARKKAPPPPKRAPTTALTLRSKSMTSELEELVDKASIRKKKDKPDEIVPASKPSRTADNVAVESRVATIKQRPTSRCFPSVSDMNSVYERQGIAVMTPTVPGSPKGPFLGLPRGTMRRQKSIASEELGHCRTRLDPAAPGRPSGTLRVISGSASCYWRPGSSVTSRTIVAAGSVEEAVILPFRIPPPPLASVDLDEDFIFTEPLPPPLEFANSFDIPDDRIASVPALTDLVKQKKHDASQPPPLNPSQPANCADGKKPAGLSNCLPASFLPPPENFDAVTDSGIEEVDSRSSSDHHLETTSTVSTVSSMSTLSSEGGDNVDTCTVYADGQAFTVDKPPVPPKPKVKPIIPKSNALYQDALVEEDVDSFVIPPPAPPPPPGSAQPGAAKVTPPRTSKLWGDVSEVRSPIRSGPKANVISELNSILQQMNREKSAKPGEALDSPTGTKPASLAPRSPEVVSTVSGTRSTTVTFTVRPGTSQPITLQSRPTDFESRTSGTRRAPSPVVSPTEMNKETLPAPLPAAAAVPSPTLSEVFSLPSQPPAGDLFGLNPAGRSRSPSPSILQQPISNKPFTTKPVHLWTKPDVADWLESLNLGEHKETFMDNEIDGSHLPNLQKEDLIDLGVTRVGHRMNIERALKQLLDR